MEKVHHAYLVWHYQLNWFVIHTLVVNNVHKIIAFPIMNPIPLEYSLLY